MEKTWKANWHTHYYAESMLGSFKTSQPPKSAASRTLQISQMVNHIIGTTKTLDIGPVKDSFLELPSLWHSTILLPPGRNAMADTYTVTFSIHWILPTHLNHQYSFFVSGIFTPPVLRDSIHKFFQSLEILMNYYLCNVIWYDSTSCRSDLVEKCNPQTTKLSP